MSKGKHLVITCISPEDVEEKRFYFYKDGAKIVPGNKDFEFSPVEPGSGSKNNSVLSIPRANPNITGEFTCEYEKKVSGRWVTSQRSQAVKVTIAGEAAMSSCVSGNQPSLPACPLACLPACLPAYLSI